LAKLVVQVYVILVKIARGHAFFHPQQQLLGDLEERRSGAYQHGIFYHIIAWFEIAYSAFSVWTYDNTVVVRPGLFCGVID